METGEEYIERNKPSMWREFDATQIMKAYPELVKSLKEKGYIFTSENPKSCVVFQAGYSMLLNVIAKVVKAYELFIFPQKS